MKKFNFTFNKLVGIAFAFIIFLFPLLSIAMPDKAQSAEENRVLAQRPKFTVQTFQEGRYQTRLTNYLNDQFPFRNGFISWKTAGDKTLGKLESNGVYDGRNHYLLEKITVPDSATITSDIDDLKSFKEKYSNLNMFFLLAPNSANILNDNLPFSAVMADQNKYMDQFFARLSSANITPIDLRPRFKKEKKNHQLYYRTDHHWTTTGAYIAYKTAQPIMKMEDDTHYRQAIVKTNFRGTLASKSGITNGIDDTIKIYLPTDLNKYLPSIYYYTNTKETTTSFYQLDNLKKKDAYSIFGGWNHPYYTIKTPTKSNRRLLLIKDSYANCFIPFLTQNFREIAVVDPRYYFESIDDIIKTERITDVLFLYNGNTFAGDDALNMMISQE